MAKIHIKTPEDIEIMRQGGFILHEVKKEIKKAIKEGISAWDIEELVTREIVKRGAKPSFKMVPGYKWSTCININDGVVHGIPKKENILKNGDIVSIDLGVYYKGFHTDTALSFEIGTKSKSEFLETGQRAVNKAIKEAKIGKTIGDISKVLELTLREKGYSPVKSLTGHGVGRSLHEDPPIPNYVSGLSSEKVIIKEGFVLAIEVMYSEGTAEVYIEEDGWTIKTNDGKIAALFEETVAVTKSGPLVLT